MGSATTLEHFLLSEYAIQKQIKDSSTKQILYSINLLKEYLQRDPLIEDLNDATITNLIVWLQKTKKMSKGYVKRVSGNIKALWNQAFEWHYLEVKPQRIPKIKEDQKYPDAWLWEEVNELLAATKVFGDSYMKNGIQRRLWWQCWVLMAYESAFRGCDLLQVRFDMVNRDGCVKIVQEKTGLPHIVKLSTTCLDSIDAIRHPQRDIILDWPHTRRSFQYWFGKLIDEAGLKGSPKYLRRSAATHAEAMQEGLASKLLGHRTPGLAKKNYIDPAQMPVVTVPMPLVMPPMITCG